MGTPSVRTSHANTSIHVFAGKFRPDDGKCIESFEAVCRTGFIINVLGTKYSIWTNSDSDIALTGREHNKMLSNIGRFMALRPVPNAAPLMCRTKLNTVRLWSDFRATADSDGVLASDLIREGHGKQFSMRIYAF